MKSLNIVSSFYRNRNAHLASRYRLNVSRENIVLSNKQVLINFKNSI
jgi:hypothetical protein